MRLGTPVPVTAELFKVKTPGEQDRTRLWRRRTQHRLAQSSSLGYAGGAEEAPGVSIRSAPEVARSSIQICFYQNSQTISRAREKKKPAPGKGSCGQEFQPDDR